MPFYPRRRHRRPARRHVPKKRATKKTFVKKVLAVVNKHQETKYCAVNTQTVNYVYGMTGSILDNFANSGSGIGTTAFTANISSTAEIYALLPPIQEGPDSWNRIGDYIAPVKARIDLDLLVRGDPNANTFDYMVHVFLLTSKSVKNLANYTAIPITFLLDNGQGSAAPFDGTAKNSQMPIDRKEFNVIHHKKIRLCTPQGLNNGGNIVSTNGMAAVTAGNGMNGYGRLSLSWKPPKKLSYNLGSDEYPTNYAPFLCIGWVQNSQLANSTPDTITTCMVTARTHLWYKDS